MLKTKDITNEIREIKVELGVGLWEEGGWVGWGYFGLG
jgi:hypothetical protein